MNQAHRGIVPPASQLRPCSSPSPSVTSAGPAGRQLRARVGRGFHVVENALNQWIRDVQQYGMRINYARERLVEGRQPVPQGTVDFAASDIPFQSHPTDGSAPENPVPGSYAYMPITSGGTVFMYNLEINGKRVTDLRLSGENIAKIYTRADHQVERPRDRRGQPGAATPEPGDRARRPFRRCRRDVQHAEWMIKE